MPCADSFAFGKYRAPLHHGIAIIAGVGNIRCSCAAGLLVVVIRVKIIIHCTAGTKHTWLRHEWSIFPISPIKGVLGNIGGKLHLDWTVVLVVVALHVVDTGRLHGILPVNPDCIMPKSKPVQGMVAGVSAGRYRECTVVPVLRICLGIRIGSNLVFVPRGSGNNHSTITRRFRIAALFLNNNGLCPLCIAISRILPTELYSRAGFFNKPLSTPAQSSFG